MIVSSPFILAFLSGPKDQEQWVRSDNISLSLCQTHFGDDSNVGFLS